jgi:RNA polymerase sigma factor (sigma-70 family)
MVTRHISDERLINLYLAGNDSCLEALIHRYEKQIFAYIMTKVGNEQLAQDLFQDSFIKIINCLRAGSYVDEGKFLAWAYRVTHNLIVDYWRVTKRLPVIKHEEKDYDIFNAIKIYDKSFEETIIIEQIHRDIRKLIEYLPEEQRQVVHMRHFCEMTFSEIAEELNININTALGRMRYALKNLKRLVKEKELILTY